MAKAPLLNMMMFVAVGSLLSACDDPTDCTGNEAMGYAMAILQEDGVKPRIPNPHVADFDFSVYRHIGEGLWELRGHADTKNTFGGPVRVRFHGTMQCHSKADSRTWTIESLSLSEV